MDIAVGRVRSTLAIDVARSASSITRRRGDSFSKDAAQAAAHIDEHGFGRAPSLVRRLSSLGTAAPHLGHSSWIVSILLFVVCFARLDGVARKCHRRNAAFKNHTPRHKKNTKKQSAVGHLLTAIIGAGVLGLPNALAWLGWVGGVVAVLLFYLVSVWLGVLLSEVYHAKGHPRFPTYKAAVRGILGRRHSMVLATAQTTYQLLTCIGYTIAAAESLESIIDAACGHAHCIKLWQSTLVFGGLQLLMSQVCCSVVVVVAVCVFRHVFGCCKLSRS